MSQAVRGRYPGSVSSRDHHQNLVSFLDAAESNCYVCEFARQRLTKYEKRDNCRVGSFKFRQVDFGTTGTLNLDVELSYGQEHRNECVGFWATPTQGFATKEAEWIRRRKGYIPEAEAVIKIGIWMGNCLRDHDGTRCRKNGTKTSSYPSRLLELGPSSIRVISTTVKRPRGPYATLSYCWGPNPAFLRLTSGNKKKLEAGLPTSQLPLAFRESISIIQALSFRYLWIDSLCIIQSGPGSAEDWETESARMHRIYADSTLTLALASVASPTESIFNQARSRKTAAPPLGIRTASDHQGPAANTLTILPRDYFTHALHEQPLSSRAWALQERVMATRVVSFGLGELFWDCAQLPNASESIPGGLQATQIEPKYLSDFELVKKTIPEGADNDVLLKTWWNLLDEYMKRRLTYPKTDRLMALSAIAHETGKSMEDVYIAGHFWKTLPASLNWILRTQPPSSLDRYGGRARRMFWSEKPGAQEDGPCTPSWSWASLAGPVFRWRYVGPYYQQLADAVSYTLELANQANPTGPCNFASISIRAYCTEIEWQSRNEPAMVAHTDAKPWAACEKMHKWLQVDLDEPEVRRVEGTRSLMIAIAEEHLRRAWTGLVVERIPYEGEVKYRRIGHFFLSGASFGALDWWNDRISIFGGEKRLLELV